MKKFFHLLFLLSLITLFKPSQELSFNVMENINKLFKMLLQLQ